MFVSVCVCVCMCVCVSVSKCVFKPTLKITSLVTNARHHSMIQQLYLCEVCGLEGMQDMHNHKPTSLRNFLSIQGYSYKVSACACV